MRAADAAFTMPRIRASANRPVGTPSPLGGVSRAGQVVSAGRPPSQHRAVCQAKPMHYGDCTYQEIAALADDGAVAVVPLGCTEQQGPHLPVDFDTWFSGALAAAAASQAEAEHSLRVLVLPVLPMGPTPEHRSFGPGYLDLPIPVHEAVVQSVTQDLGFQIRPEPSAYVGQL